MKFVSAMNQVYNGECVRFHDWWAHTYLTSDIFGNLTLVHANDSPHIYKDWTDGFDAEELIGEWELYNLFSKTPESRLEPDGD